MFGCIKKEEDMLTFCHSYPAVLAAYLACLTLFVLRSAMIWYLAVAKVSTGREEQRGSNQGQRKESRFSDSLGDLVLK